MVLVLSNNASAWYCYQESANISNQTGNDGNCEHVYRGYYGNTGQWANFINTYDGAWNTLGYSETDDTYFLVNYTKPIVVANNTLWQVREGRKDGTNSYTTNLTIPDSCWNYNPNFLMLRGQILSFPPGYQVKWQCFSGTWETLRTSIGTANYAVYEEAMWWNIPDPAGCFIQGYTKISSIIPEEMFITSFVQARCENTNEIISQTKLAGELWNFSFGGDNCLNRCGNVWINATNTTRWLYGFADKGYPLNMTNMPGWDNSSIKYTNLTLNKKLPASSTSIIVKKNSLSFSP